MSADFQKHYSQLIDTVNTLVGYNGEIGLKNHINMNGSRVTNIGPAVVPTDALASGIAASRYSAEVLAPQLAPSGKQPMVGYRQVNNQSQREQVSSFLNDLMSSVPSANSIFPTITNVGGGVQVSIPAGPFTFADRTTVQLNGRTDILSLPAQFAIASISSSGRVITVVTATPSGLVAGEIATIAGVTPASFNGVEQLTSATPPDTLTYQGDLGTLTGSGGFVQTNNVYYYSVQKRSTNIFLQGAFSADTAENRLQVNFDGFQIVAVVVVTADGGQVEQSGGGGSPITGTPAAGAFF